VKLHLFRQDLQDYQDFFGLVYVYPHHPVDPVRKWNDYAAKFFIRLNWPRFRPAAALVWKGVVNIKIKVKIIQSLKLIHT
jgi:hypothetical protein